MLHCLAERRHRQPGWAIMVRCTDVRREPLLTLVVDHLPPFGVRIAGRVAQVRDAVVDTASIGDRRVGHQFAYEQRHAVFEPWHRCAADAVYTSLVYNLFAKSVLGLLSEALESFTGLLVFVGLLPRQTTYRLLVLDA